MISVRMRLELVGFVSGFLSPAVRDQNMQTPLNVLHRVSIQSFFKSISPVDAAAAVSRVARKEVV
jgi:hypothetical protein